MQKIKVTAQQRANAIEARDVMWPSVPPQNVVSRLQWWSDSGRRAHCGTHACFGGWCVQWPSFIRQGVKADEGGYPHINQNEGALSVSEKLFGDWIFASRGSIAADLGFDGTDHELVTHRLNWLIENSEVTA